MRNNTCATFIIFLVICFLLYLQGLFRKDAFSQIDLVQFGGSTASSKSRHWSSNTSPNISTRNMSPRNLSSNNSYRSLSPRSLSSNNSSRSWSSNSSKSWSSSVSRTSTTDSNHKLNNQNDSNYSRDSNTDHVIRGRHHYPQQEWTHIHRPFNETTQWGNISQYINGWGLFNYPWYNPYYWFYNQDPCQQYANSKCYDAIFPERCYANYYERCRMGL